MKEKLVVRVAHHISGFWAPFRGLDALRTGSIGAGLLVDPYTITGGWEGEGVFIPGFSRVPSVIKNAEKILGKEKQPILIKEPLPPARGYATSASMTISYTLYRLITRRGAINLHTAGRVAHVAEVLSKTGLGDVSAIMKGAFIPVRRTPGGPGIGVVDSIIDPLLLRARVITVPMGVMSTIRLLSGKEEVFRKAGMKALSRFDKDPTLEGLLEAARNFSLETGMMPLSLDSELKKISRVHDIIGYFVKKKLLVVVTGSTYEGILEELKSVTKSKRVRVHKIVQKGVEISSQ